MVWFLPWVGASSTPRVAARARLAPVLTLLPWTGVALLVGVQALWPATLERYTLYPLLVGIVLLGLPHGALDHLVPARMGFVWGRRPLGLLLYLGAYGAVALLYLALWLWQPRLAFVGFLLATVWHWGQGDLRFLELFLGRERPSRWGTLVTTLLRGGLPMVLPVLAFPATAESVYHHAALGLGATPTTLSLSTPPLRMALASVLLVSLALYLVNAVQAAPNRGVLLVDVLELVLLVALFTLIPAYLAVGVYFLGWHSLRHLARLLTLREEDARCVARGAWGMPVVRLARDLTPVTLVALALLLGLYGLTRQRIVSLEGFVALYLTFISALTKPHLLVVAMMDLEPV